METTEKSNNWGTDEQKVMGLCKGILYKKNLNNESVQWNLLL